MLDPYACALKRWSSEHEAKYCKLVSCNHNREARVSRRPDPSMRAYNLKSISVLEEGSGGGRSNTDFTTMVTRYYLALCANLIIALEHIIQL